MEARFSYFDASEEDAYTSSLPPLLHGHTGPFVSRLDLPGILESRSYAAACRPDAAVPSDAEDRNFHFDVPLGVSPSEREVLHPLTGSAYGATLECTSGETSAADVFCGLTAAHLQRHYDWSRLTELHSATHSHDQLPVSARPHLCRRGKSEYTARCTCDLCFVAHAMKATSRRLLKAALGKRSLLAYVGQCSLPASALKRRRTVSSIWPLASTWR